MQEDNEISCDSLDEAQLKSEGNSKSSGLYDNEMNS